MTSPSLPGRWLRLNRVANAYPHPTHPWIAANLWSPQQLGPVVRFGLDDAPPCKLLPGPVPWEIVSWVGDLLLVAARGRRNALGLVDAHGNGLHHELALPPETRAVYAERSLRAVTAWAFDARDRWTGHRFTVHGESLVRVETLSPDTVRAPAWHPDGARFAEYRSQPDGARPEVVIVEDDARKVIALPPVLGARMNTHLAWTGPDTLLLADADQIAEDDERLFAVTASTGDVEALNPDVPAARICLSPSQTRITCTVGARNARWVQVRSLVDGSRHDAPWSPEGAIRPCCWINEDTLITLTQGPSTTPLVRVWNVSTQTAKDFEFDRANVAERFDAVVGCGGRLLLVSQRTPRRVFLCDEACTAGG